jgi:hypothetical protein
MTGVTTKTSRCPSTHCVTQSASPKFKETAQQRQPPDRMLVKGLPRCVPLVVPKVMIRSVPYFKRAPQCQFS